MGSLVGLGNPIPEPGSRGAGRQRSDDDDLCSTLAYYSLRQGATNEGIALGTERPSSRASTRLAIAQGNLHSKRQRRKRKNSRDSGQRPPVEKERKDKMQSQSMSINV
jgi:hypothetical protein